MMMALGSHRMGRGQSVGGRLAGWHGSPSPQHTHTPPCRRSAEDLRALRGPGQGKREIPKKVIIQAVGSHGMLDL
jgi:hypothetical protein